MAFTPRYTKPDPDSNYYDAWNRFYWLDISPYGGNCTGYAYGRSNEIAGRSLYNEFYMTGPNGNAKNWIYNSWSQYTHTSGAIDLHLGDILVWGGGTYGHVEVVEAINGNRITLSGSVWGSTYGSSREFYVRTIDKPSWGSDLGAWYDNNGTYHYYTNTFIGYIHNPYAESGPTPSEVLTITITPSSYSKTMAGLSNYVDFDFSIEITGIPNGESVSGGNTYPGLSRVYNTGWTYTDYTVDGVVYRKANKRQTLRYERESNTAYTTVKHMYFNLSFSTGTISTDTVMNINVESPDEPSINVPVLAAIIKRLSRGKKYTTINLRRK